MAERIFRILLWLYPAEHRLAYGDLMLQHARDLERGTRQRRGWLALLFYLRLIQDGILNAGIEQWEAIMGKNRFTPASWITVLLATIPGLLVVFSRIDLLQIGQVLPRLITIGYLAILVIGVLIIWVRQRRFPVWALLPAGLLFWMVVYMAGTLLAQLVGGYGWLPRAWQEPMLGFVLLEIGITVLLLALTLRGLRLSTRIWLVPGAIIVVNLLLTILFFSSLPAATRLDQGIPQFLYNASIGLLDGLMLVAAGMLAARRHGTLAMLVVIGGFGYMCLDSDFISGFRFNEWAGYAAYALSMSALYLVVTPVALLRARTRLGRALAVFIPVGIFHIARIAVPNFVLPDPYGMGWGDILLSVNVLFNFVLAWVLYSRVEGAAREQEMAGAVVSTNMPSLPENSL